MAISLQFTVDRDALDGDPGGTAHEDDVATQPPAP